MRTVRVLGFVDFLSIDRDLLRGANTQPNFIATNFDDSDDDVATDDDGFITLAT